MKKGMSIINNVTTKSAVSTNPEYQQNFEKPLVLNDMNATWVKNHIEKFGTEPNIYDGA